MLYHLRYPAFTRVDGAPWKLRAVAIYTSQLLGREKLYLHLPGTHKKEPPGLAGGSAYAGIALVY